MTALTPGVDGADYTTELASPRHASLERALSGLRGVRRNGFPLPRVLLTVGGLCLPLGIIVIIIGWYGSAHTLNLYEQNDYLISGGMLGLGLVIAGGFLYFGYWMTRQLEVAKQTLHQMELNFARLEDRIETGSQAGPEPAAVAPRNLSHPPLVATERGSLAHRSDCQVVAGRANLRAVEPGDPGFRPCRICSPFEGG